MIAFEDIKTYINPTICAYFLNDDGTLNDTLWNTSINQIIGIFQQYYACFEPLVDTLLIPEVAVVFNYYNRWKAGDNNADKLNEIIGAYELWLQTAKENGITYCNRKNKPYSSNVVNTNIFVTSKPRNDKIQWI